MTYLRALRKMESSNLGKDDIDDIVTLTQDRDINSGGIFSQDGTAAPALSNSKVPYKLIGYDIRVWTTQPCLLWTSEYGSLEMVELGGGSENTGIIAENLANSVVKKYTLTDGGKTWSHLSHKFCGSYKDKRGRWQKWGKPRYMRDNKFKIQIQNLDPRTATQDSAYYVIVTYEVEYDA